MNPITRYQVRRSPATRKWRIVDVGASTREQVAGTNVLIDGLPTEAIAFDVKLGVAAAYLAGAQAVKNGEVIL
jgi:hypothetical protein